LGGGGTTTQRRTAANDTKGRGKDMSKGTRQFLSSPKMGDEEGGGRKLTWTRTQMYKKKNSRAEFPAGQPPKRNMQRLAGIKQEVGKRASIQAKAEKRKT